jgi:hypothetical protein
MFQFAAPHARWQNQWQMHIFLMNACCRSTAANVHELAGDSQPRGVTMLRWTVMDEMHIAACKQSARSEMFRTAKWSSSERLCDLHTL